MTSCCCSSPDCKMYGCRQMRTTGVWPTYPGYPNRQYPAPPPTTPYVVPVIPPAPRGCVCPVGAEKTCQGDFCPRLPAKAKP